MGTTMVEVLAPTVKVVSLVEVLAPTERIVVSERSFQKWSRLLPAIWSSFGVYNECRTRPVRLPILPVFPMSDTFVIATVVVGQWGHKLYASESKVKIILPRRFGRVPNARWVGIGFLSQLAVVLCSRSIQKTRLSYLAEREQSLLPWLTYKISAVTGTTSSVEMHVCIWMTSWHSPFLRP